MENLISHWHYGYGKRNCIIHSKINSESSQREQWVICVWQFLTTVLQQFRMGHLALWLQLTYSYCNTYCQKRTLKFLQKVHPHIILYNNHSGKCSWLIYSSFNPSTACGKTKTNPWHISVNAGQQHLFLTFSRGALVVLHLNSGMYKLSTLLKIMQWGNFQQCS